MLSGRSVTKGMAGSGLTNPCDQALSDVYPGREPPEAGACLLHPGPFARYSWLVPVGSR